ncbi:MAG TPA: hypothetical protein VGI06_06145 [Acidimicrobiales bacterium]|jgi:hypothetical protein
MTTLAPTISLPLDGAERASRRAHPARARIGRPRDGKLARLAALEALAGCGRRDLEALASVADLTRVPAGTVLADGPELRRQWWMPVDGWLLAEGHHTVSRTVPAGWSWAAPRFPAPGGRLTAVRESWVLVAPVPRLGAVLEECPRLGTAVRATLVGGDV